MRHTLDVIENDVTKGGKKEVQEAQAIAKGKLFKFLNYYDFTSVFYFFNSILLWSWKWKVTRIQITLEDRNLENELIQCSQLEPWDPYWQYIP